MTTIANIAKAHNVTAIELNEAAQALQGLGKLYARLVEMDKAGVDKARAYLKNVLRPIAVAQTYAVANMGLNQRDALTPAMIAIGYDIVASKLITPEAKDALVKSAPKISQYYKSAGVNHPFAKASAPKTGKAHKGGVDSKGNPMPKGKPAKTATAPKLVRITTTAQAIAALLENETRGATFCKNNPNYISKKVADYMAEHVKKLEALLNS